MAKRITSDRVKKWARGAGLVSVPLAVLMIFFIASLGAFDITGYSGDSICAGTIEDPCYAYINFTVNEDVFIYPSDDWGQTAFYTDPQPKSVKMYRSWGKGWREIDLTTNCKGTWCGASDNSGNTAYSFAFREDRDYELRYEVLKESPNQTLKWGFDKVDPVFLSVEEYKSYDEATKELTLRNSDVEDIAKIQLLTPLNHRVGLGYQRVIEYKVSPQANLTEDFFGQIKTYDKEKYDKGDRIELDRVFEWKYKTDEIYYVDTFECSNQVTKNGTAEVCEVNGSDLKSREVWVLYDKKTKIKKGENIILGLYTDVQVGDYVEWVQEFTDKNIKAEMWATWTADLNIDIISYYKLDDSSTTIAVDSVLTSGNDGTVIGATPNVTGIINTAYSFDGSNDEITTNVIFGTNDAFTLNLWVKTTTNGEMDIIGMRGISSSQLRSYMQFQTSDIVRFRIKGGALADISFNYNDGNWHMYTLTYDGSSTGEAWIDGVSKGAVTVGTESGTAKTVSMGRFFTNLNLFYNGDMDEVGMWSRSLSAAEITQLYNGGLGITWQDTSGPQPPTITASATKPDNVFTNTDWLINITASDGSAYIDTWIKFYVNDSNVTGELYFNLTNNTNSLIATLGNGNFSAGDNLTSEVWVGNTDGNSSKTNFTETVQFISMSGTLKDGDGQNLNATVFIINQTDDSLVGNTTSLNGVWTFGPLLPGTYVVTGYDPSNATLDGDAEPHVVIPE